LGQKEKSQEENALFSSWDEISKIRGATQFDQLNTITQRSSHPHTNIYAALYDCRFVEAYSPADHDELVISRISPRPQKPIQLQFPRRNLSICGSLYLPMQLTHSFSTVYL
jgi:hypothetical protein